MRNRLAHGYDTVDDALVFATVMKSFAPLIEGLERELTGLS